MPHSIFLGSHLATQDRISRGPDKLTRIDSTFSIDSDLTASPLSLSLSHHSSPPWYIRVLSAFRRKGREIKETLREVLKIEPASKYADEPKNHQEHENHSYAFVRAHMVHGMVDIAVSLLGIAVVINSLYVASLPSPSLFSVTPDPGLYRDEMLTRIERRTGSSSSPPPSSSTARARGRAGLRACSTRMIC